MEKDIEKIIAELEEWHQKKGRAFFLLAADLEAQTIFEQITDNPNIVQGMIAKALTYKVNQQLIWKAWTIMMKQKLKLLFKLNAR